MKRWRRWNIREAATHPTNKPLDCQLPLPRARIRFLVIELLFLRLLLLQSILLELLTYSYGIGFDATNKTLMIYRNAVYTKAVC
jgi:hypothetical protein